MPDNDLTRIDGSRPTLTDSTTVPTLADTINATMAAIGGVEKSAELKHRGQTQYKYRSIDAIVAAVKPAMVKSGLIISPVGVSVQDALSTTITKKTTSGFDRTIRTVVAFVTYRISHTHSGESMESTILAEGQDSEDKAITKMYTYAYKTLLQQLFAISDEPDPDSSRRDVATEDAEDYVMKIITDAQNRWHHIDDLLDKKKIDDAKKHVRDFRYWAKARQNSLQSVHTASITDEDGIPSEVNPFEYVLKLYKTCETDVKAAVAS